MFCLSLHQRKVYELIHRMEENFLSMCLAMANGFSLILQYPAVSGAVKATFKQISIIVSPKKYEVIQRVRQNFIFMFWQAGYF